MPEINPCDDDRQDGDGDEDQDKDKDKDKDEDKDKDDLEQVGDASTGGGGGGEVVEAVQLRPQAGLQLVDLSPVINIKPKLSAKHIFTVRE